MGVIYENDIGMDLWVMVGGFGEIFDKVLIVVLGFLDSIVMEIRVGFRLFIFGFFFVIGSLLNISGFFVVNGFGVLGLMSGLYFGVELVKFVFGW